MFQVQKHRKHSLSHDREMETHALMSIAINGYMKELGLNETDRHLLEGQIELREADPGTTLLREHYSDVNTLLISTKNLIV